MAEAGTVLAAAPGTCAAAAAALQCQEEPTKGGPGKGDQRAHFRNKNTPAWEDATISTPRMKRLAGTEEHAEC